MPLGDGGLRPPFVPRSSVAGAPLDVGPVDPLSTAVLLFPQGPSLRSGLCCPGPSSLVGPIRPTRRHTAISPTRLIRDAFAVRERRGDPRVVPRFRCHSFSTCRPLRPRRARRLLAPSSFTDGAGLHPGGKGSVLSISRFRGYQFAFATTCRVARLPYGDFYFRAFNESVTLLAAGYDYGGQLGNLHRRDLHPLE